MQVFSETIARLRQDLDPIGQALKFLKETKSESHAQLVRRFAHLHIEPGVGFHERPDCSCSRRR